MWSVRVLVVPPITCGTTVDNGVLTDPQICSDQSWDTAAALDPRGVQVTDVLCKADASIWRKIAVQPGQQISIILGNAGPHTRLALFKDLRADLQNEHTTILEYRQRVKDCDALEEYALAESIREILGFWKAAGCMAHTSGEMSLAMDRGACGGDAG